MLCAPISWALSAFLRPPTQATLLSLSQIYVQRLSSEGRWECFSLSAPDHEEKELSHIYFAGICEDSPAHPFRNRIVFYEAVPFLFHLSSRFAENNLNFMQQQLRGIGASLPFPHTGLAWSHASAQQCPPSAPRHPMRAGMSQFLSFTSCHI